MAKQTVNVGNNANDGSGDAARTAFTKLNQNMNEIYNNLGDGNNIQTGEDVGNVMKVGALGFGSNTAKSILPSNNAEFISGLDKRTRPFRKLGTASDIPQWAVGIYVHAGDGYFGIGQGINDGAPTIFKGTEALGATFTTLYCKTNTTTDGNGYLKPSSPVVRLYADKIEAINEAVGQGITFEKLGVGNYLVKNTTGLREDGWYIETPRDSNGNVLVFVEFTQLENKDISVKTFKKKFDIDTASIVADHTKPMDIPTDRWIDLRFNDYPIAEQPTLEATS